MLLLAQVIVQGAIRRNESRGAHFKPDHPARDDREFGHTTLASHAAGGPRFSPETIDLSLYPPVERKYEAVDATLRRT